MEPMHPDLASLLIRQHMALINEGIGPVDERVSDRHLLERAVIDAWHRFKIHDLWEANLASGGAHNMLCDCDGAVEARGKWTGEDSDGFE